jgi:outer membrane protein assembly factor BamA
MGLSIAALLWWLASLPPGTAADWHGPRQPPVVVTRGDVPPSLAERVAELDVESPPASRRLRDELAADLLSLGGSGYLDASARVAAAETGTLHVTIEVDRGNRWRWGNIAIDARPVVPLPDIGEPLGRLRGRECVVSALENAVYEVLDVYDRNGYPFAEVQIESLWERDGLLDAAVTAHEGPLVKWGALHLVGPRKTRAATAERIVGFESGAPFDVRLLRRARPRMLTSGLFSRVSDPVLRAGATPDVLDLEIQATEARTSSASGAVGYVPPAGRKKGYFVGSAELALENMAGTGRSAAFSWRSTAPGVSSMSVEYREPWLLGSPFSLQVALAQEVYDTTYTRRRGEAKVGVLVGDRLEASVGTAGERVTPAAQSAQLLPTSVKYEGSVRLAWEARDNRVLPERGWFADVSVSYGRRSSQEDSLDENTREATARLVGELYLPAGRYGTLELAGGCNLLESNADRLPAPFQFPLGGAQDVRGYREEQFRGAQVAWLNIAPWLLRWPQGAVGPFVDLGYHHLRASWGGTGGDAILGYGIAVRSLTKIGLLNVDYGIGEDTGPLDGRIHVSMKALF